jgi:hypothetical protein
VEERDRWNKKRGGRKTEVEERERWKKDREREKIDENKRGVEERESI